MEESIQRLTRYKEVSELFATYIKWGTLLTGGFCLLIYSNLIGQFPEGINLGEGLAFYLVSVGFFFAYTAYVVLATSAGCLLSAIPVVWAERKRREKAILSNSSHDQQITANYSAMWSPTIGGIGVLGLIILGLMIYEKPKDGLSLLLLMVIQGFLVGLALELKQRVKILSGIILPSISTNAAQQQNKKHILEGIQKLIYLLLLICPIFIGLRPTYFVESGFRIAQLRKENATIHVKKPWDGRISSTSLKCSASFLGSEYAQCRNITVLLRSVGSKVVIELPANGKAEATSLPIPSDSIYIE